MKNAGPTGPAFFIPGREGMIKGIVAAVVWLTAIGAAILLRARRLEPAA